MPSGMLGTESNELKESCYLFYHRTQASDIQDIQQKVILQNEISYDSQFISYDSQFIHTFYFGIFLETPVYSRDPKGRGNILGSRDIPESRGVCVG